MDLNKHFNTTGSTPVRVAVLGFGGLGKGMVQVIRQRRDFSLVGVADSTGYCFDKDGLDTERLATIETATQYPEMAVETENAIIDLLKAYGDEIDGIFMALPNLPVEFFKETVEAITEETGFRGVIVDALKRTEAVERLFETNERLRHDKILYITGAGATPGFLTTVAAIAAHSFVEVEAVNIHFGVGVANWDKYKATVREDFIHLKGFDAKRVACMTDAEIEEELEKRGGLIELHDMEHADDVILELAGVCPRDRVTVGGLVDTRNAKKPVSTTVTVRGKTAYGVTGEHTFTVSDEATMVDNVCGPALGFLLRGVELWERGQYGVITSADIMPRFSRGVTPDASTETEQPALATV